MSTITKYKIIQFIEACEEYPLTEELVQEFCDLMFPYKATTFIEALLELIDEAKILYDSENQTWAVLKGAAK